MRNHFNKLVRDRIPDLIRAAGKTCDTEVLSETDYRQALRAKLIEEAQEVATAQDEDLITELADVQEVLMALMAAYKISPETVRKTQMLRREARGSFRQRIRLLWTDEKL
ncbi:MULTISPECIES: nucleoside triphosphate pyrophosphohydrolase [unclassified Leptolyngbya]|uniref:nucleoside triphosphate pyrophosphohydrolase n=1 Tax=unclassified Leptolyngbya TaxID=2650499 RepID=UPI001684CB2A|nr:MULTISPECIES: nucleoside triphosphate pyrophosphohydrolase [unclassified Leptolyngbya]MBD1911948.1 nucleoside triphosphate pyrophosphohydrolase [Leptolyngbya sp. FACHB-8]MBD2154249.1 nucleoside triphosphate pyrophosphohydrolase [Leptolyngbya sp. FACHB-16]